VHFCGAPHVCGSLLRPSRLAFYPAFLSGHDWSQTATDVECSGFANNGPRLLVIANGNESAVPQVSGIRPFHKGDLDHQPRFEPTAFLHFFGRE